MRVAIGLILLFGGFVLGIGVEYLSPMVDIPSLQFIIVSLVACFLIVFDIKTIFSSIKGMITGRFEDELQQQKAVHVAQVGLIVSVLSSVAATVISFILLAGNAENMHLEAQGPNMAVAMIPMVYGMMLGILFTCGMFRSKKVDISAITKVFD